MNFKLAGKILLGIFICLLPIDAYVLYLFYQNTAGADQPTARVPQNQPAGSVSTPETSQKTTPTAIQAWAEQKLDIIQTATAAPKAPVSWRIEILQNGVPVAEQDGVYALQRAPFTIRARLSRGLFDRLPVEIILNVLDRPDNYQKVHPGSINDPACDANDPDCFVFFGMAEPGSSTGTLVMDLQHGTGSHVLYYNDPKNSRWDHVEFQDQEVILDRNVTALGLHQAENQLQNVALGDYTGKQLYLVFLLEKASDPMVTGDALKKAIIHFP